MEIKDALGLRPIAEAAKRLTDASVDAASAFLSRICLPAAEEFGLLLRDRVHAWRATNLAAIAVKAEQKLLAASLEASAKHAHPRLVGLIVDQGSWTESDEAQELWAGLLASSCTEDGRDDSNLMFVDILGCLSISQVRVFDYACKMATIDVTPAGWLNAGGPIIDLATLKGIANLEDIQRLDRELDHLRTLGILNQNSAGFNILSTDVNLTPSPLGLQMYARCNGHRDPVAFYRQLGRLPPSGAT